MKAAPFDYVRAADLQHALELLAQYGADAKLLAGGQSLVPMMAMRLVRPAWLIDIHRLAELQSITQTNDAVVTGAGVRQRVLEDTFSRDGGVSDARCAIHANDVIDAHDTHGTAQNQAAAPTLRVQLALVAQALRWAGHGQTRNRGTVGGSLVQADPSAELPLAALVLGATLHLARRGASGAADGVVQRRLNASAFFTGPMSCAADETECLTAIEWPVWQGAGIGSAFDEVAIRHGDFALASAAAQVQLDAGGVCRRASFGTGGVAGVPLVFPQLAQRLLGQQLDDGLLHSVAADAAAECDPGSDPNASSAFRRHLAEVLMTRVLRQAARQAAQRGAQRTPHAQPPHHRAQ